MDLSSHRRNTMRHRVLRGSTREGSQVSTILVTGGAGYIGSHTVLALLEAGHEVVVLDSLINSSAKSLDRVAVIAGRAATFVQGDVRDAVLLRQVFSAYRPDAVFHFAGLKAVGESAMVPLDYYDANVYGGLVLARVMAEHQIRTLVFSSSATVYQETGGPLTETSPIGKPASPYGRTKLMVEHILGDLAVTHPDWRIAILRYFNPVGAHRSGTIGEDPTGTPNNLVPYIAQVAVGRLPELAIFGDDYATPDGTGVRDYVHVVDLACGHLRALDGLNTRHGVHVWNLGTGGGSSVLQVVKAFERVSGRPIPYRFAPHRQGDVAVSYADASKAWQELAWRAEYGLDEMLEHAWRWQSQNPVGYRE